MPFEITKTELVWPGKYDDDGKLRQPPRVSMPFQVIERVNESRATRDAQKQRELTLFDVWKGDEGETFEEGWRNKLIWGDNLLVMSSLLDQFAGKIDLIYIDPPFATGSDFSLTLPVGEGDETVFRAQTAIEERAYRDTWGKGKESYLAMMDDRLLLCRQLLSSNGTIYVHLDYRMDSYVRLLLDEVLGQSALRNSIAWCYTGPSRTTQDFPDKHDTIYRYCASDSPYFDPDSLEVRLGYAKSLKAAAKPTGIYAERAVDLDYSEYDEKGKLAEDWWSDITPVGRIPTEDVKFPTQKPEKLLRRIIDSSCPPGGLVADMFVGSGTTLVAAERLGRRWVGCDLGRFAIHTSRKRLLGMADCRPFEILNLGKYERRYWQGATFGEDLDMDGSIALYEYIAFILKLYGASAVSGMGGLHGKIGKAFVHVGAVDSPVTIQEIAEAVEECKAVKGSELHVLGWEWEMGVNDLMVEQANQEGVKLLLARSLVRSWRRKQLRRGTSASSSLRTSNSRSSQSRPRVSSRWCWRTSQFRILSWCRTRCARRSRSGPTTWTTGPWTGTSGMTRSCRGG